MATVTVIIVITIIKNAWLASEEVSVSNNSRLKDLLAFAPLVPIFFLIARVSNLQKALISVVAIYTFYVLISEKWANRRRIGFWIIVAIFSFVHAIIIYNIKVESKIAPAMIFLPLAVLDFFFMYRIIGAYETSVADRRRTD